MHREREQLVFQLFTEAFDLPHAERSAFLAKACGADRELRTKIEQLLATADTMDPEGTWETELEADIHRQAKSLLDAQNPPSPEPGEKIGHYVVTAQLGAGSMGQVYAATDTQLKRSVAIKIINTTFIDGDQPIERMRREALLVAALNHPNIITLYGLAAWRGQPCLVMEHLQGHTLDAHLAHEPLALKRFFQLGIQMVHGLRYAHQAGVIHRDIKPANTFITDDDQVKLLDFGLAKWHHPRNGDALASMTQPGQIMGTIAYMSPEQVRGQAISPASDIFSMGVVLYEMLSGRRPFEGHTNSDIMSSILRDPPRPMPSNIPLPGGLEQLILACLDKVPSNRPSITNVLTQLKRAANTAEGRLQKFTRNFRLRRRRAQQPHKRRFKRGLAILILVALTVWFTTLWLSDSPAEATIRRAQAFMQAGDLVSAEIVLQDQLANNPKAPRLWHLLSKCQSGLGKREAAFYAIEQAYAHREALADKAQRYRIQGQYFLNRLDYRQALKQYQALRLIAADVTADMHFQRSHCHSALGEGEAELAAMAEALALAPENPVYQGSYLIALADNNRFAAAIKTYQQMSSSLQTHPHVLWGYSKAQMGANDMAGAAQTLQRMTKVSIDSGYRGQARFLTIQNIILQGDLQQAAHELERDLAQDAQTGRQDYVTNRRLWLANTSLALNDPDTARRVLQPLLTLTPTATNIKHLRTTALLAIDLGDVQAAQQLLATLRAIEPFETMAPIGQSAILQVEGLLAMLSEDNDPLVSEKLYAALEHWNDSWNYWSIAKWELQLGNEDKAKRYLDEIIARKGRLFRYHYPLLWHRAVLTRAALTPNPEAREMLNQLPAFWQTKAVVWQARRANSFFLLPQ